MHDAVIDVDLWYADYGVLPCDEIASAGAGLLDAVEQARRDRFVFERDRLNFAVSHILLRRVLSYYGPLEPAEWRFEFNSWGKPRLANPELDRAIHFNLSHTRGSALIGVSRGAEIGVDVERTDRDTSCVELADRYFSTAEVRTLLELPPHLQRERFFELWTLKESYIKARGMGLAIPLDQFSFVFPSGDTSQTTVMPDISFAPPLDDRPHVWQFVERPIGKSFRAAAAAQVTPGTKARFSWKQAAGEIF